MKVLLIDPFAKTVTEVEHDGSLKSIYELTHCGTFTSCPALPKDDLYLDDEGLLGNLDEQAFFTVEGYSEPLAGYAIAVGCDDDGDTTSPVITITELQDLVKFRSLAELRLYKY